MILHANGSYESADWHTPETYPDSYFIDDQSALAAKIMTLFPYFSIITDANGELIDVEPRDKTPEEIEAEKPKKTPDQLRIEQLENESAMIAMELIDTQIALEQTQSEQAALLLALIDGGVL
ncbi:hypothetical protein [Paenibacillus harenae]|uniref:hypothetical protein n=1 Tax=Paenibacillus harenae TaxID=306543 RepID=UPI00040D2E65|nr:hypothetical protein [Paenibacillus harenae]